MLIVLCEFLMFLLNYLSISTGEDHMSRNRVWDILNSSPTPLLEFRLSGLPIMKEMIFKNYELAAFRQTPYVAIPNSTDQLYTMVLIDPDVPTKEKSDQDVYMHWLVINIFYGNYQTGSECIPYAPPTPPANTGQHRYIFALYIQSDREVCKPKFPIYPGGSKERAHRKLRNIVETYGLKGPISANAFYVDSSSETPDFKHYD
ncbi:hypothetical protein HZS_3274 [Henneguya salminicola]|nr:hypothetical protein HZS_3274 [Henneguya salminicola]